MASFRRGCKNIFKNYNDIKVKVREATSNDPWGPSSSLMGEISDATYNVTAFSEIMSMLWKRLNDSGKLWRHVYKSLTVLEYIVKTGSERVAQQCRENIFAIQTLKDFQHIDADGKDQGMNVREKSKQLVALLKDEDRLKNERQRALKAKERFAQSSGGVGNSNFKTNKRFGSSQGSLPTEITTTQDDSNITTSRSWDIEKPKEFDRRSADGRFSSDLEKARPSNEAEEELQYQLAIALSKQQAEQDKKLQEGDDERFKIALRESQHRPKAAAPFLTPPNQSTQPLAAGTASTLLDLSDPGAAFDPSFTPAPDPWGDTGTNVAPSVTTTELTASDPWGSQPTNSIQVTEDPWGSHPGTDNSKQPDPWGNHTEQEVKVSDPWKPDPGPFVPSVVNNTAPDSLTNGFDPRGMNSHPQAQLPSNPFDFSGMEGSLPPTNSLGNMEQSGSFLGENARLVNLENILGDGGSKPAVAPNPFAVSVAPKGTNPFLQDKPKPKSINELRVQQTSFTSGAPQPLVGGDILLPAPLIPDSGAQSNVNSQSTNPFI